MAGGFPLEVNGVKIRTSEALYQACRFPHIPKVQHEIIAQRSPMTAKMKGKPHRSNSRSDWDAVRIKIMRWCLQVKLALNWDKFSDLLLETGDMPIVEHSRRDDFWGAKPVDGETLVGTNALGRLLMELRERVKDEPKENLLYVAPLPIDGFLLYEDPIKAIGYKNGDPSEGQAELVMDDDGQDSVSDEPAEVEAESPPSAQIAETGGNYSLPIDDCHAINLNNATASGLAKAKLPGIGTKLAQRIVAHRDENGHFESEDSLLAVPGVGPKIFEKIATKSPFSNLFASPYCFAFHAGFRPYSNCLNMPNHYFNLSADFKLRPAPGWHQHGPVPENGPVL